jgi:hypothetical protein
MFTGTPKDGYIGVDENVSPRNSSDSRRDLTPRRRSLQSPMGSFRLSDVESDVQSAFPTTFEVRVMEKMVKVSPVSGTMVQIRYEIRFFLKLNYIKLISN